MGREEGGILIDSVSRLDRYGCMNELCVVVGLVWVWFGLVLYVELWEVDYFSFWLNCVVFCCICS